MSYKIYHIPGVKIGVSNNPKYRVRKQGYENYEVLEEHEDIYIVSNREQELQEEYGFPVDNIPYWKSIENLNKKTEASYVKMHNTRKINGYDKSKKRSLTMEQAAEIRSKYIPYKHGRYKLAKEYGVSVCVITRIVNNLTYIDE